MKLKELSPADLPRERLQHVGPSALSDSEILALLLQSGTKTENVLSLSQRLVSKHSLQEIVTMSVSQLQRLPGIGLAKACQIVAAAELSRKKIASVTIITTPEDVFAYASPRIGHLRREHFMAILLNTKHEIIRSDIISVGTLNEALVHPREVFRSAIEHGAHAMVLVHNHPSGDPTPSDQDRSVTKQLQKAADIIGIQLLDHIVVGSKGFQQC